MSWAPSRALRRLTAVTAVATYLLIVMGGIVRVTGSGLGCGDKDQWPLCHGALLPPLQQTAVIEFTHRWVAAVATALVVSLVAVAWIRYRHVRRLVVGASVVLALFILQIVLGAITVEFNLPSGVIMIHLANALLLLGALVWIAAETALAASPADRPRPGASTLRWAAVAAGATYLLALSGAFVVDRGAGGACAGWPLCGNGFQVGGSAYADVNLLHRFIAGVVVVLLGFTMLRLRRARPGDRALRITGVAVTVLLVAQVVAGLLVVDLHLPAAARALHLALASALWGAVVLTAAITRGVERVRTEGPLRVERSSVRAVVT